MKSATQTKATFHKKAYRQICMELLLKIQCLEKPSMEVLNYKRGWLFGSGGYTKACFIWQDAIDLHVLC